MIEVFGHQVNPGEKAYFTVPVGQLSHQAVIEIPVIVVAGKKEGTVLWVNGTVHGDELNGSYAAWELSRELDPEKLSGTFIVTQLHLKQETKYLQLTVWIWIQHFRVIQREC